MVTVVVCGTAHATSPRSTCGALNLMPRSGSSPRSTIFLKEEAPTKRSVATARLFSSVALAGGVQVKTASSEKRGGTTPPSGVIVKAGDEISHLYSIGRDCGLRRTMTRCTLGSQASRSKEKLTSSHERSSDAGTTDADASSV